MTYEELQKENRRLRKIIKDSSDIDVDLPGGNEIILSGGTIHVNLDGLDYMTRESFKEWCRQHAITNSEPTFNL
jgi:hypothetical protein